MAAALVAGWLVPAMLWGETPTAFGAAGPVGPSTAVAATFDNPGSMSGSDVDPGELVIPVSGMPSLITDLTVTLRGLDAASMDNVKITIVSPDGTAVDLIDSACQGSTAPVSAKNFLVDDRLPAPLPKDAADTSDSCWINEFFIKPSNHFLSFPSEPTTLAALRGHVANGNWTIRISTFDTRTAALSGGVAFTLAADDPDTVITAGPANGGQSGSTVSFEFASPNVAGAAFQCSLDAAVFTSCPSPHSLSNLSAGAHTFRVRAATGAGNAIVDPTPAQVEWVVQPPPITRRPDGLIRKGTLAYVGNGIYNTTGTGQTVTAKKRRTRRATFFVGVQNDGTVNDTFTIIGAGDRKGFRVRYFGGHTDITSAVVAGSFRLRSLASGQQRVIKLVVKVKATAKKGILRSWLVTARSTNNTTKADTVRAKVKVPRG
jgi:hypothetical protein